MQPSADADGDNLVIRRRKPAAIVHGQSPVAHGQLDGMLSALLLLREAAEAKGPVLELQCGRADASRVAAQCGARLVFATDGGGDGGRSLGEVVASVRRLGLTAVRVRRLDPCELPRLLLASSLVADLHLVAAALVWGLNSQVFAAASEPGVVASVVSLACGALVANLASVILLVVETLTLRR